MSDDLSVSRPQPPDWKVALVTIRTQVADYEREGTSTPGKLKRAARLRACRIALRDFGTEHSHSITSLKLAFQEIERAEKDDDWRQITTLIQRTLAEVDGLIGQSDR